MFEGISTRFPHSVMRVAHAVLRPFNKRAAKENWEFSWQQRNWLSLWRQSEVKAKCLDYWNRYRHLGDIRARLDLTDQTTVLDVGCGFSSVLHYLPGRRFGLDPLGARYKSVYDYPFEVVEAPGEDIPFPNEFFDVVFCSNCIDHTSVPAKVMKEILRVLRASGHFILTCEIFPSDRGIRNAGHPHSLTIESFLALPVGFKLLEHWVSPWYGLRGYALGENPTGRYEHILLLQKPPS